MGRRSTLYRAVLLACTVFVIGVGLAHQASLDSLSLGSIFTMAGLRDPALVGEECIVNGGGGSGEGVNTSVVAKTHHRYLLVHAKPQAASMQAREVWRLLQPSMPVATDVEPHYIGGLALCKVSISSAIKEHLREMKARDDGRLCHLHIILVLPNAIDLVYVLYHEAVRKFINEDSSDTGQDPTRKEKPRQISLRDWSKDELTSVPGSCFRGNRPVESPDCCIDQDAADNDISPFVEAILHIQSRRWKEQISAMSRLGCKLTITDGITGTTLPGSSVGHYRQQMTCLLRASGLRLQNATESLFHDILKLPLRPRMRLEPLENWDLQTHSKVSIFFQKHGSLEISVHEALANTSLKHDVWVNRLKVAAYNCSLAKAMTVVFCEHSYVRVLLNWMAHYSQLRRSNPYLPPVLIVSMTPDLHTYLEMYYPCSVYLSPVPSLNMAAAFWKTRLHVFLWLSRWNFTVIHSDVDAVWLRNPAPAIMKQLNHAVPKARFVFSQDIYPGQQFAKWGATACMGLFAFRGGRKTSKLWSRTIQAFVRFKDDQRAINHVLDDGSLLFEKRHIVRDQPNIIDGEWFCARSNHHYFTACLLPQSIVLRACGKTRHYRALYVAHCHSGKVSSAKEASMRRKKFWKLRTSIGPSDLLTASGDLTQREVEQLFYYK